MDLEEAAKYIGLGKTSLYQLARDNKLPASKRKGKWIFDQNILDEWIGGAIPVESFFQRVEYEIEGNLLLREPQIDAHSAAYEFFKKGGKQAIIQLPVGCGKSGLAAILPFGIAEGRVLVISPSLTIKDGLSETLDISNRAKCFWRKARILAEKVFLHGPFVCNLNSGNLSICEKSHIIVTNIHQLSTNVDKWLNKFPDNFFDLIIVDEGHHSAADSWQKVFSKFANAKIIHLTATPFRSDEQEIEGELIYRYSFNSACIKGFIKKLKASYVMPSQVQLSFKSSQDTKKVYTLEQVLKLKENDSFSRGISLSEVCNKNIVDNSLSKLEELRQTGTKHQLIAVACNIDHAKQIRSLYAERGYSAEVIHSYLTEEEREQILLKLKSGNLDCIVQVQILGEGFDHPKLSVAAIFRPFRSLAPYIQFVGRILRVIVQNDPSHPDNYGYIVTHIGMNLDQRLKEFRAFENDDQAFWDKVISGSEPSPARDLNHETNSKISRIRDLTTPIIEDEILEGLFEEDFITLDDEAIIKDLEQKFRDYGMDPSLARQTYLQNKQKEITDSKLLPSSEAFSVTPQQRWKELKKRLVEKTKSTANQVLVKVGLKPMSKEITLKYKISSANNNLVSVIAMISKKLNDKISSKEREQWTEEEFLQGIKELENIAFGISKLLEDKKKEYKQDEKA